MKLLRPLAANEGSMTNRGRHALNQSTGESRPPPSPSLFKERDETGWPFYVPVEGLKASPECLETGPRRRS